MSGILGVLVASGETSVEHDVAVGFSGFGSYGFSGIAGTPYGSISPSTIKGQSIFQAYVPSSEFEFTLWIEGLHPRTFIKRIRVQDSTGAFRDLSASAADFSSGPGTGGDSSRWTWEDDNPVWTTTHASRSLVIYY